MDKARREALALSTLAKSSADRTEVTVYEQNAQLTRFTHNAVHQSVAAADVSVRVRAVVDGRTGVVSTNVLEDPALHNVVDRALAIAKLAPRDSVAAQLPRASEISAPPGAYVERTAAATPDLRAKMCADIFSVAVRNGFWSAGYVTTSEAAATIVNSDGGRASFRGSDAAVNVKMNGADSTGYGEAYGTDVDHLDASAIAEVSAQKTRDSAAPRAVEPGSWTVILEPAAFGELLAYLAGHFSAQSFDEGSSFISGALGERALGENVTVSDDYAHPLAPGMPFDWEGQPTQRLPLISRGVAQNIVTDSYYAAKLGRPNTGHALPAPNAYGPQATHLIVQGGEKTIEQLISETERGLFISRFWYIRTVDQKRAIVTGMTRDGTFLIEGGTLAGGVRNMRFNQSIIEALSRCEFSKQPRRTGGYSYSLVVPAAKIENFTFSSATEF